MFMWLLQTCMLDYEQRTTGRFRLERHNTNSLSCLWCFNGLRVGRRHLRFSKLQTIADPFPVRISVLCLFVFLLLSLDLVSERWQSILFQYFGLNWTPKQHNKTAQPKQISILHLIFSPFNCCLSVVLQLEKGDNPDNSHAVFFHNTNSFLFNLSCVWILSELGSFFTYFSSWPKSSPCYLAKTPDFQWNRVRRNKVIYSLARVRVFVFFLFI